MPQTIDVIDSVEATVLESLHQQDGLQSLIDQSRMVALHLGAQSIDNTERVYQDEHLYISVNPNTQRVWVSVYAPDGVTLKLNDTNHDIDWTSVLDISDDGQPETMLTWVRLHNLEQTWVDHLQQLASGFPVRPEPPMVASLWMLEATARWVVTLLQPAISEHLYCEEILGCSVVAIDDCRGWLANVLSCHMKSNETGATHIPDGFAELHLLLNKADLQAMQLLLGRLNLLLETCTTQTQAVVVCE